METSGPRDHGTSEVDALGERLRAARPHISDQELDGLKTRIFARANSRRGGREFFAFGAIALAVFAGGTGVTAGAVALSGDHNAAVLQYDTDVPPATLQPTPEEAPVVDDEQGGGTADCKPGDDECSGVLGLSGSGNRGDGGNGDVLGGGDPRAAREALEPTAQVAAAGSGSLPFTGYLVIPALALSLILGTAGAVMLRTVRRAGP